MLVGIIIGAIIIALALYDYFSSKNWQMLTSEERNETVFEKRNKAYGAYQIRRDYNNRILLILLGLSTGIGGIYAATKAFSDPVQPKKHTIAVGDTEALFEEEDEKPVEEKKPTEAAKQETAASYVFDVFKIINNPNESDTLNIPDPVGQVGPENPVGNPIGGPIGDPIGGNGDGGLPPQDTTDINGVGTVTESAYFVGGKKKMIEFIANNIKQEVDGTGTTKLKFLVDKDGAIAKVWVVQKNKDCDGCDEAAIDVVKKMPNWVPGKNNGTPVKSYFYLPISFK